MERWRAWETWDEEPGLAMGLDEELLEGAGDVPVLRFYTWSPPALSLGYFQRFVDVPAVGAARAVVRRVTGGGAIHHARELTFSIAAPRDHRLYAGAVSESYERVHDAIADVLRSLGLAAGRRGAAALASDRDGTGMCFHESTPLDLAWNGRKGVGSAQRRTAARILHHGSIKLARDPLEPGVATVDACGRSVTPDELAALLRDAFAERFGIRFEAGAPSAAERAGASARAARFVEPTFVRRR